MKPQKIEDPEDMIMCGPLVCIPQTAGMFYSLMFILMSIMHTFTFHSFIQHGWFNCLGVEYFF